MGWFDPQAPIDPNVVTPDYGMGAAAKQRELADALRKQADAGIPEGKMVSGHYVAPSWTQQLGGLASSLGATYLGGKADDAEAASAGQLTQAKQKWLDTMPQAQPDQFLPGREGSLENPNMPTPGSTLKGSPVTTAQILKHSLAGEVIPGMSNAAKMYQTGALAEVNREDTQAANKEQREITALAEARKNQEALEFKREQLTKEMERYGADRASRDANAAAQRALQAQIAEGAQGIQRLLAEAKAGKAEKLDHLPAAQISAYVGNQKAQGDIDQTLKLLDSNPNAVGYKGMLPDSALSRIGTEGEKATRAAIANIGSLKMHDRSGATVTVGEEPRLLPFIPKISDPLDIAQRKLKNLRREAEKHNLTIEGFADTGGYRSPGKTTLTPDDVLDAPAKGRESAGKVGAALPTYSTQAEVDKLKPGTKFMGPDGKQYTKN